MAYQLMNNFQAEDSILQPLTFEIFIFWENGGSGTFVIICSCYAMQRHSVTT